MSALPRVASTGYTLPCRAFLFCLSHCKDGVSPIASTLRHLMQRVGMYSGPSAPRVRAEAQSVRALLFEDSEITLRAPASRVMAVRKGKADTKG